MAQTNRQTDKKTDILTLKLNPANGLFSEKYLYLTFPVTKAKLRLFEILWDDKICRAKHCDVKKII